MADGGNGAREKGENGSREEAAGLKPKEVLELLNSAETESIDELIRNRRAQLEDLRARNRAMMESLLTSSPVMPTTTELQAALQDSPKSNDEPNVEATYLRAFMQHSAEIRWRLDSVESSMRRLEDLISFRFWCSFTLWLLLFGALLVANGALLQPILLAVVGSLDGSGHP